MQEYKKTLGANSNWSSDSSSIFNYIDVFTAKTKSPLLIELPLLGYTVYLDLVSFNLKSINNKKALDYLMYCRFEQIKTASTHQKNVIEKNRQQVYYNSAKHFCKSIFDNKLKENGFLIAFDNFIFTYPKLENRTFVDINPYLHYVNTKEVQVIGLKNKQLDIYYFCKYKGRPTNLAIKSKKVGSSNIPFEDCFIEDDSYVIFKSDTCIIRPDGTIPDNNIQFGGKMASKAGGALLPNDYLPENDN